MSPILTARWSAPLLLVMAACGDPKETGAPPVETAMPQDTAVFTGDADGDGVSEADGDCDDSDSQVFPGRLEDCNGRDDNCNGQVDEGLPDGDGDGLADCVDEESCDGLDNNGDGQVDEGFADSDGDGVADCTDGESCDGLDNDGDGLVDEGFDLDGDGWFSCALDGVPADCDDQEVEVNPGATEVGGNLLDDDCDGLLDESDWAPGALLLTEVMNNPAQVGDNHGEWFEVFNVGDVELQLNGLLLTSSDGAEAHLVADDALLSVAPGAYFVFALDGDESSNGGVEAQYVYTNLSLSNEEDDLAIWLADTLVDQLTWDDGASMPDPSGASLALDPWVLQGLTPAGAAGWCAAPAPWGAYTDLGTPGFANDLCSNQDRDGDGWSIDAGDCAEGDASVSPGALEQPYDGVDNDCDALTLDDDLDSDGFLLAEDCDDLAAQVHPGAPEVCDDDDLDEDCDGLAENDDPDSSDTVDHYPDEDGDGFGAGAGVWALCDPVPGWVADNSDCDDSAPDIFPGASDSWYDGIDQDCAGDDDFDADGDGYQASDFGGPDCDDGDAAISPAGVELCDEAGLDEDCDGLVNDDDPSAADALLLYPDEDGDGYGNGMLPTAFCGEWPTGGYARVGTDCDDTDASVSPAASEIWYDGVDQDCKGFSDYDADGDFFAASAYGGDDCDDTAVSIHPYAWEDTRDGLDNDCDGAVDAADGDVAQTIVLSDDSTANLPFASLSVDLCGTKYTSAYVSSNGRLTFGSGNSDLSESAAEMAQQASLAGLWDDLYPPGGTGVFWVEYGDAVGIYFRDVPEYSATGANTFAMILLADGRFMLDYGAITGKDAAVGWSCGQGDLVAQTDLSRALDALPAGATGVGQGSESMVYQVFTSADAFDLANRVLMFCVGAGTDSDGDGWTDECGDTDDSNALVHP